MSRAGLASWLADAHELARDPAGLLGTRRVVLPGGVLLVWATADVVAGALPTKRNCETTVPAPRQLGHGGTSVRVEQ